MSEEAIKAEVRLWALECVVSQLFASVYQSSPDPEALFARNKDLILQSTRRVTAGADPAMSDLLSAELELAVERLLHMQARLLGVGGGKSP